MNPCIFELLVPVARANGARLCPMESHDSRDAIDLRIINGVGDKTGPALTGINTVENRDHL